MRYLLILFAILLFPIVGQITGCGKDLETKSESTEFSYDYDENGCKTGKQVLHSKEEYCQALKDYKRNSGCAFSSRKQAFQSSGCSGEFKEENL